MNKLAFKERMKSLKSYREQNPDKGYWEWKQEVPTISSYQDGGYIVASDDTLSSIAKREGGVVGSEDIIGPITEQEFKRQNKNFFKEKYRSEYLRNEGDRAKVNPEFANYMYDFDFDQLNSENLNERKYTLFNYEHRAHDARTKEANKHQTPFIPEKELMLRVGRFNTGRISTNVLDSLYASSQRTGVPFVEALGLAGRESGLGYARHHRKKGSISNTDLLSNWQQIQTIFNTNPMTERKTKIYQKYIDKEPISSEEMNFVKNYILNEQKEYNSTKPIRENVYDNALRYYESGKYNPGDPNYKALVKKEGLLLLDDPGIKRWMNAKGQTTSYKDGGEINDDKNNTAVGGYTEEYWPKQSRLATYRNLDPTMRFSPEALLVDNQASGEENEYWKAYLGLDNAVPAMNKNAHTEWDEQIEKEKIENGELPSDFYGTTPSMDLSLQAAADTLMLGKINRNYDEYKAKYHNLPGKRTMQTIYETAKNVMNNPGKWQQMDGEYIIKKKNPEYDNEVNPLGMLAEYGMKWDPESKMLYVHDTYDFPWYARAAGGIKNRPKEMKIRSAIKFDPKKGSVLLRTPENYNEAYQYQDGGEVNPYSRVNPYTGKPLSSGTEERRQKRQEKKNKKQTI